MENRINLARYVRDKAGKNMNPVILQHIADIKFAHLKEISLNGNCIESVEVLGSVCMPSMMKLILGHNRINKIRTIVKADWPKLKDIHVCKAVANIVNNVIVDMSTLTGIFSKELEWITSEYASTDPEQSPDLRWILKLQTNELKALRLKSMHRIKDPKGRGILEKRYEGISAKYYE